MCASLLGTMSRSEPTRARPVARMRRSPFAVRGCSVVPVCRPLSDHSVSPWRTMKTRGVGIVGGEVGVGWLGDVGRGVTVRLREGWEGGERQKTDRMVEHLRNRSRVEEYCAACGLR